MVRRGKRPPYLVVLSANGVVWWELRGGNGRVMEASGEFKRLGSCKNAAIKAHPEAELKVLV